MPPEDRASYFFCRHEDEQSLRARTIIGSIAKQLAEDIPSSEFVDLDGDDLETPIIVSFLIRKLSRSRQYYIIIDGLDECEVNDIRETIEMLSKLIASPLRVSVYCSTRPAILNWLPSDFRPERVIAMEDPQNYVRLARDMTQFVEKNLTVKDQEMESIILNKLQEGAEGM